MLCCKDENLAKKYDEADLSKEEVLTPQEKEFDKLLRDYINGIKIYLASDRS